MKSRSQYKAENAILDDVTQEISYNKAKLLYNCCVLEYDGDLPDIEHTSDIVCNWRLEYKDNPSWNVTITNAPTSGQGTTSMRYYRWNLRFKSNSSTVFTYADGTSETKKGYVFGTSYSKCNKYTMKINYASSPQSHKIGSTLLYNDLYHLCVNNNHQMAVKEAPFMIFQKRGLTYTFVGLGTGGYDKGDKNFFDWNTTHPSLISLEGPNHDPLGTIFEALWDDGVQYSYRDETLKFGQQEGWDVAYAGAHLDATTGEYVENDPSSADDVEYIQELLEDEWKPAYDLIFGCSPYITTRESVPTDKVVDLLGNVLQVKVGSTWYGWSNTSGYTAFVPCGGDTIATRNAYFKTHYQEFFNKDSLVFTHCFLQLIAATDNYAKNFYPIKYDTLENGGRWEFRQDDLDSIFDTDNDGVPSKSYYVEFNDKSSTGVGIFQGDVSALWQLVHANLTQEIHDMYNSIVTEMVTLGTGSTVHDTMFDVFGKYYWNNAQNYFPLHSYNADFIYKYYPAWLTQRSYNNVWPLHQALGDRLEQEKSWVKKRVLYELSKYELAGFANADADGYGSLEFRPAQSCDITITPAVEFYPNANSGGGTNIKPATPRVPAGTPATLHIDVTSGTTLYLKALDYLESLGDLSSLKLVQQGQGGAVSLSFAGKALKDITLGGTNPTINVTELQLGNLPCLEVFTAKNVSTLASNVYLQSSPRLESVDVSGTAVPQLLTTAGSRIESIKLSPVATILALNVLPQLEDEGIVLSNPEKVRYLLVRNCNGVDPLYWLKQVYNAANSQLQAVGLEWSQVIECVNNDAQIFLDLLMSGDYGRVTGADDSTVEITSQKPLLKGSLHFDTIYAHVLNALNQYSDGLLNITADVIIQPSPEDVNLQVTPLLIEATENVALTQPITISTAPLLERVIKTFYHGSPEVEGAPEGWSVSGAATLVYTPVIAENNTTVNETVGRWNVKSYYAAAAQKDVVLKVNRVGMTTFDVDLSSMGEIPQEGDTAIVPISISPATCTKPVTHIESSIGTIQSDGWHITIPSGLTLNATLTNKYDSTITKSVSVPINQDLIVTPSSLAYSENVTKSDTMTVLKSRFVESFTQTTTCPDITIANKVATFTANIAQNNQTVTDNFTITTTGNNGSTFSTPVTVSRVGMTSLTIDGPDKGFEGETLEYTIGTNSGCTKPNSWFATDTIGATISGNKLYYTVGSATETITLHVYNSIDYTVSVSKTVKLNPVWEGLTFKLINGSNEFALDNYGSNNPNCEYSTDGQNWTTLSSELVPMTVGVNYYIRGNNSNGWSTSNSNYSRLYMPYSGNVEVSGNVMSLIDGENFETLTTIPCDCCFYYLFAGSEGITTPPELPATNLTESCYNSMFYGCTSLVNAPSLPATTLTFNCYEGMFNTCTSLVTPPSLPALSLEYYCYRNMFRNCTSLKGPVNIYATSVPSSFRCNNMFTNSGTAAGAGGKIRVGDNVDDWNLDNAGIDSTYWTVELITE